MTPTVPVTVEYELTPLGRELLAVVLDLKAWAEGHVQVVQAARARYDGGPAPA